MRRTWESEGISMVARTLEARNRKNAEERSWMPREGCHRGDEDEGERVSAAVSLSSNSVLLDAYWSVSVP